MSFDKELNMFFARWLRYFCAWYRYDLVTPSLLYKGEGHPNDLTSFL